MADIKYYTDEETLAIEAEKAAAAATPVAPAAATPAPVENTEVNTPTPAETTTDAPAAAPIQSARPEPKEILGESYANASWDEVTKRLTRLSEVETKHKELEDKVKEYSPADAYVAELNNALKKGISREAFQQFYQSNPEKLSPAEKVSLYYQMRDGLSKEKADLMVNYKYHINDKDFDETTEEAKMLSIQLEQEAAMSGREIAKLRAELMVSPLEKATQSRVKEFEPIVPTIVNELQTLGEGDLAYKVPAETIQMVNEHLNKMLASEFCEYEKATPEAVAELKALAKDIVKGREFDNYVKHLTSVMEKKQLTEKVNPRPSTGTDTPPAALSRAEIEAQVVRAVHG